MAISRFAASRVTQGLPKYQSAWDVDNVAQGSLEPISSVTLSAAGILTVTNIPQHYQDLVVVINGRALTANNDAGTTNQVYANMYFNNVTTAIHSLVYGISDGTSNIVSSFSSQANCYVGFIPNANAGAGIFGTVIANIMNYSSSSTFKHIVSKSASDCNGSGRFSNFFNTSAQTTPITRIDIYTSYTSFAPGTTIALYGVRASL